MYHHEQIPESWFRPMPAVDFDSLCGMADLKRTLRAEIDFATDPRWQQIVSSLPSPAYLFYGPPGTGKSRTAAALARGFMEKGYRLLAVDAADLLSCYVGEAEKRVEQLFRAAADSAPCVLQVTDVEAVCLTREVPNASRHRISLTNTFLASFRELWHSNRNVVFIMETNAPWNVDPLLVDWTRTVRFSFPDDDTRAEYFRRTLSPVQLNGELQPGDLVEATAGASFRYMKRLVDSIRMQMAASLDPADLDALKSGRICPTRAMLEQALRAHPPQDHSAHIQKLEAFENRFQY